MRPLASTVPLFLAAMVAPARAHPGGTDSSGCHNDNINGGRHCHGGGSGGEVELNPDAVAQIGIEVGIPVRRNWSTQVDLLAGMYLHHDTAMTFTLGVSMFTKAQRTPAGAYFDVGLGGSWYEGNPGAIALRLAGGVRVSIWTFGPRKSVLAGKLGLFADFIGDGINSEPMGIYAALGISI